MGLHRGQVGDILGKWKIKWTLLNGAGLLSLWELIEGVAVAI